MWVLFLFFLIFVFKTYCHVYTCEFKEKKQSRPLLKNWILKLFATGDQVEISASLSNDNKSKSASLNFLTEVENKSDNQCRISSSLGSELWNTWNLFLATNVVRRLCGKYVPTYSIKCVSPGKPALGCGLPRCQQRMIIAVCVPTVFCNCKWSLPLNINTLDIAQSY